MELCLANPLEIILVIKCYICRFYRLSSISSIYVSLQAFISIDFIDSLSTFLHLVTSNRKSKSIDIDRNRSILSILYLPSFTLSQAIENRKRSKSIDFYRFYRFLSILSILYLPSFILSQAIEN